MHGLFFLLSCAFGLSCMVLSVTYMSRSVSECEKTHIHTSVQGFSVHVQTPVRSTLTSKNKKKITNLLLFVYKCTYIYLYLHNLLVVVLIIHRFLFALFSIHSAVLVFIIIIFYCFSFVYVFDSLFLFFFLSIR